MARPQAIAPPPPDDLPALMDRGQVRRLKLLKQAAEVPRRNGVHRRIEVGLPLHLPKDLPPILALPEQGLGHDETLQEAADRAQDKLRRGAIREFDVDDS